VPRDQRDRQKQGVGTRAARKTYMNIGKKNERKNSISFVFQKNLILDKIMENWKKDLIDSMLSLSL